MVIGYPSAPRALHWLFVPRDYRLGRLTMCGIAGIITRSPNAPVEASELNRLRDAQTHRGPDGAGTWISSDGVAGLAHRRLAIIDLSPRGHQPMSTPDGRLVISFNGEIYNYRELRDQLEKMGERFQSDSDTETILLGYRRWGSEVVDRLRGMFAFGIWDESKRELFLARDPLGIKPLYWMTNGDRFLFASEIQALGTVASLGEADPRAVVEFLEWGSIASPATLYRDVRALEAGQWMRVQRDLGRQVSTYWKLEEAFGHVDAIDDDEALARAGDALRDSVRQHLIADVPVGAFLSGGVDSVSLVGLLTEIHGGPIETVTLGGEDPALDETKIAARAASYYGTRHHEIRLTIEEVRDRVIRAVESMDQPTVDGINSYLVSEAAHLAGLKVAVSGVGGDELFGGYDTFRQVPRAIALHGRLSRFPGAASGARMLGRAVPWNRVPLRFAKLGRLIEHGSTAAGAYSAFRGMFSRAEVNGLLTREFLEGIEPIDPEEHLSRRLDVEQIPIEDRVSGLEIRQYLQAQLLRDTDVASMAHALEVRTPLVDRTLLREVMRLPAKTRLSGPAKRALRTAPRKPVPEEIWNRQKQGFALPFDLWLRSRGLDLPLPTHRGFSRTAMNEIATGFFSGRVHWSRLWALMVVGRFLR